jgi:hypothetical protein
MEATTREAHDALTASERPDGAPLRGVGLFGVASFWAFYGALTVATEVLEPHHGRRPLEALAAVNPRIFLNPVAGIMKFSCAAVCDYPSADRGTRRWSIGWV